MSQNQLLERNKQYFEILRRPIGIKAQIERLSSRLEKKKAPQEREELIERIEKQKNALRDAESDILDLLDHVPDIDDHKIARLRYIECMLDTEISEETGLSRSRIRKCSTPHIISVILANQIFAP